MASPRFGFGGIGVGGGGTLPGSASNWSGSYGGVPNVPSPGASQGAAIGSNLSNLSRILQLSGGVNTFNDASAISAIRSAIPGYDNLIANSSQNILKEIQGDIPNDVVNEILQHAAERGILTGTVGSDNNNAALMRAIGVNSLAIRAQGEQNLTNAIARTPRGDHIRPEAFMVSPDQWQDAQMASNVYASAPIPRMAAGVGYGAAQRGLQAGLSAGAGAGGGRPWMAAPSWDQVGAASRVEASYPAIGASYGSGPFPQDVDPSWQARTFGLNPAFGAAPGSGYFYSGANQGQFFPDPMGGSWDLDTGDYYG